MNVTYSLFCSGRICSEHLDASCYDKPAQHIALNYSPLRGRKLRLDAIPTLYLFAELHVVKGLDACAEDAPKTVSDRITEAIPSTTLKIISESIAETEPSSTVKSQPAALDSIAGDAMITTATTADYSTIV